MILTDSKIQTPFHTYAVLKFILQFYLFLTTTNNNNSIPPSNTQIYVLPTIIESYDLDLKETLQVKFTIFENSS